ncbi:MAG: calcium-binding protein [Cyanophyceae cyanobacterium]
MAIPGSGGTGTPQGLGGAIFVVNRTQAQYLTDGFTNAVGLPATLPTVESRNVTFVSSSAANAAGNTGVDGVGTNQDNNDVYGSISALPPLNVNAPVLTGLATQVIYTDNLLAMGAQRLDADVSIADVDSMNFDGGSLTVSYGTGGSPEDQLGVANIGTGTGEIGVSSGSIISYEGTTIATINAGNDGTNGSPLSFTFKTAATPIAVEALIESLTYNNTNLVSPTASRTLQITINDGLNTSTASPIEVVVNNTLPDIAVFGGGINFDGQTTPFALDSEAFGNTFERSLRISNRGADTLNLAGISIPEGFALTRLDGTEITSGPLSVLLESGQALDLTLRRSDLQVTSFTGDLSFTSNDPDTPNFVIPLTGTITFEAQAPLEINFTLTRLTLPPVEFSPGSLQLEPGEIILSPGDESETVIGSGEIDAAFGFGGNDNLAGRGGRDLLNGNAGDDQIDGGAGNDRILGGSGSDRILAGPGDDIVLGNSGNDQISGGDDNDNLLGGSGDDFIDGGAGIDFIRGGTGADSIGGGLDGDFILGEAGGDVLAGEEGADQLFGGDGGARLDGGLDNGLLNGGADNDMLIGNDGNDSLVC